MEFARKGAPKKTTPVSHFPGTWQQGWLNALNPIGEARLAQLYLNHWLKWLNKLAHEPEYQAQTNAELRETLDALITETSHLHSSYRAAPPQATEAEWWKLREKYTRRKALLNAIAHELERRARVTRLGQPHIGRTVSPTSNGTDYNADPASDPFAHC